MDPYKERLEQLGMDTPKVNSTRLKEKILELEAHKKGRDILMAIRDDVSFSLTNCCDYSDAIILSKAAKILRREILDHKTVSDGIY